LKKIIFVPGKNPKPPAEQHRQQLLRCLLHGVNHVNPEIAGEIEASDSFSLVAWNQQLYKTARNITQDIHWVNKLLSQESYPESDIEDARTTKYRVARALYQIGDTLPWFIPLIPDSRIKVFIQETGRYFKNHDNIACKIRELQKQPLREAVGRKDKVLLIGHSMGSIIAYDSLWELYRLEGMDNCVDCLLTIGSPLGMNYVQRRLIGLNGNQKPDYPGNIRTWINISAHGDLVALDPSLANDFREMLTQNLVEDIVDKRAGIFNHYRDEKGLNAHKSYGYLANPVVAQEIVDWWSTV
jgi:hypothetical protein